MAKAVKKQRRNTRVVLTNLLMVVSVISIVAALTLVAMGYRLDDGELTQYGLLQVVSVPSGARVEVDGKRIGTTEVSRMMPDGKHWLLVGKPGYDTWQGEVEMKSGLLSRIDWVRLFPTTRTVEAVKDYNDMRFVAMMPTRSGILVAREGGVWDVIEGVDSREVRVREIVVPEWLAGQKIVNTKWNKNGDKLFVRLVGSDDWGVLDLRDSTQSMNMSQEFSMRFSAVALMNDAGDKLFGLENGNVRVVDLRSRTVSGVKVSGVASIGGEGETVGYVQTKNDKWVIGAYKDGEKDGKVLFDLKSGEGARVQIWKYWGEDVVAAKFDGGIQVLSGAAYGELKAVIDMEVAMEGGLALSPSGRFVVAGNVVVDVNAETKHKNELTGRGWLNDYLFYAVIEKNLVVWDFNGGNKREISEATEGGAMIAKGNGWLYYQILVEDGVNRIVREKL